MKCFKGNQKNNVICINTHRLEFNNFPRTIKNYILEGLKKDETVIIFTDDILYKDIENIFSQNVEYLRRSISNGNLKVKTYNSLEFDLESKEFKALIEILLMVKHKLRILWDFKNVVKKVGKLKLITECAEEIVKNSISYNVSNMVYINNSIYNLKTLEKFTNKFDYTVIIDRNKEMFFEHKDEINKALCMIQSNAQLKHQNNNLVLFNDVLATMPKSSDEEEFKKIIMNKVKDICDVDFCVLYNSSKDIENRISLDSYYGITKKHKYYLINDKKIIEYQNKFNKEIMINSYSKFINTINVKNNEVKNKLQLMDIISSVGIDVEYFDIVKGTIWLGRYRNNIEISKLDIKNMESICRTAFFLIQEQKKFKNMQKRLIENEKLRAMGEMAAGISHDINNILTPILGSIQLLKDKVKDKDSLKHLDTIEMCVYDGMNITNKVKKITKNYNNENELEYIRIDNIISDAINLTRDKWLIEPSLKGIKIKVLDSLESNAIIKGKSSDLREVFINIIRNAVDSMPNGGKIEISTYSKEKNVFLEIRDNGIGMNEEIKKRIFEPFFTTKGKNGSGIGLSVSYKIIESYKGVIKVESEENVGTSFRIRLPKSEINDIKINKSQNIDVNFSGNILVIDDQENIRGIISQIIKSIVNAKVKTCDNSKFESEIKRRKYDIIVCDFSMPNIDGLEIAKKIKENNPETFFCLMTGWVGNFGEDRLKNVDFILHKPINKEKMIEMFCELKDKKFN